ncbi:hypothetical protein PENFLA_c087G01479 [Penicillium flavigenum]|uniref:Uncharacterized protein n=1 Tax=Penicillium flavigenum TaxID=254877 RepID=A0A1V6S9N2_9EURO|nr:hypothetical protein PENFLA_c087G01479 [Penicillium flavigenum]
MEPPLSPTWLQIEQTIGQRPQFTGDALSMRQQYKSFADQANSSCTKSANLSIEDIKISPHLTARVYRPVKSEGSQPLPVGVYFHGGGWCCGDLDTEDPFCQLRLTPRPDYQFGRIMASFLASIVSLRKA